jgi:hypothetical protein
MVVESTPVVPGEHEYGVVPQSGSHDGRYRLPDLVLAQSDVGYRVLVERAVMPQHAEIGQLRSVGLWPPTSTRWLGVEFVPKPEQ